MPKVAAVGALIKAADYAVNKMNPDEPWGLNGQFHRTKDHSDAIGLGQLLDRRREKLNTRHKASKTISVKDTD